MDASLPVTQSQNTQRVMEDELPNSEVFWFSARSNLTDSEKRSDTGVVPQTSASSSSSLSSSSSPSTSESSELPQEESGQSGTLKAGSAAVGDMRDVRTLTAVARKRQRKRKCKRSRTEALNNIKTLVQVMLDQESHAEADPLKLWVQNLVREIGEIKDVSKQELLQLKIRLLVHKALEEELDETE